MNGGFWKNARKTGRSGFFGGKGPDVGEKMKKEVPQQIAQHAGKDDDDEKKGKEEKKDDKKDKKKD